MLALADFVMGTGPISGRWNARPTSGDRLRRRWGQAPLAVGTDPEMADKNVRKYEVNLVKNVHHALATPSKMCYHTRQKRR